MKDLGIEDYGSLLQLSIANFVISMRTVNPGDPTLVIVEDDWFESNAYALPWNVHLLSTSAWLDGLEQMKVIESASEVRTRIQSNRPNFRSGHHLYLEASNVVDGTEWKYAVRPDRPR